jgi:hypothetical protein
MTYEDQVFEMEAGDIVCFDAERPHAVEALEPIVEMHLDTVKSKGRVYFAGHAPPFSFKCEPGALKQISFNLLLMPWML